MGKRPTLTVARFGDRQRPHARTLVAADTHRLLPSAFHVSLRRQGLPITSVGAPRGEGQTQDVAYPRWSDKKMAPSLGGTGTKLATQLLGTDRELEYQKERPREETIPAALLLSTRL